MLDTFMGLCGILVSSNTKRTATEAFISVCDLAVAFSRHLATSASNLVSLAYPIDQNLQDGLINFLETFVFVDVS